MGCPLFHAAVLVPHLHRVFNTGFYHITPLPGNLPAVALFDRDNALSSLRFGKH